MNVEATGSNISVVLGHSVVSAVAPFHYGRTLPRDEARYSYIQCGYTMWFSVWLVWLVAQNTRLRSMYLFEGPQIRGRALPTHVNAAEQRKVCTAAFESRVVQWFTCRVGPSYMLYGIRNFDLDK